MQIINSQHSRLPLFEVVDGFDDENISFKAFGIILSQKKPEKFGMGQSILIE
jgi:hypothetical protein